VTEIGFYHLTRSPLEKALPRLLERTLEAGRRAVVVAGSEERVEALNGSLWTSGKESWLPHGSARDGFAEEQPIWLTTGSDNPNGASFLFLVDGARVSVESYARCFVLFDGNDPEAVSVAREQWRTYEAAGHALTYWQQNESGSWEQKG
jgi:DNA polymerase III subunit chi